MSGRLRRTDFQNRKASTCLSDLAPENPDVPDRRELAMEATS